MDSIPAPVIALRDHDKIVADLEFVTSRLKADRLQIRNAGYLPPLVFNTVTDRISQDAKTQDLLLAELFEEMAWHNPELLAQI